MKDVNFLKSNGADVDKSLELFGDMETYNEMIKDFVGAFDSKLSKIKEYKEKTDMPNYAIYVHSLKSDAKYFGFTHLADIAYSHEVESKANNFMYVYDHFNELIEEALRVINISREYLGMEVLSTSSMLPNKFKEHAILVADDSDIIRSFVKKIFNDSYDVLVANDGLEAIDIVRRTAPGVICAMLLDLNMPNCDGFEVLEYFRNNNLYNKIPVSIITGVDEKEPIDKAFKYPIVDVLTKPFNERDVKRILDKTINLN
ncbi:MAG: response regulator [Bacilli bacterium]